MKIDVEGFTAVEYKGITISTGMFEFFAKDADEGCLFRFVRREPDLKTVTIERLPTSTPIPA